MECAQSLQEVDSITLVFTDNTDTEKLSLNVFTIASLPRWLNGKESVCSRGDAGSIPGPRRPPGEWNGNPLQYSCLEYPMDRGAWRAVVHGVAKIWTRLSHWACTLDCLGGRSEIWFLVCLVSSVIITVSTCLLNFRPQDPVLRFWVRRWGPEICIFNPVFQQSWCRKPRSHV